MLASAVQKNKIAQQQGQAKALAQQIFSSSPPPQSQGLAVTSFGRAGSGGGQPLRASSPSKVNGTKPYVNPLKRTSSGISAGSTGSNGSRSFSSQNKKHAMPAVWPGADPGRLAQLHQHVDFENEFCDDADINLDEEMPELWLPTTAPTVAYPSLPTTTPAHLTTEPRYPSLPKSSVRKPSHRQPPSSTILPWSSSPLSHFQEPGKAAPVNQTSHSVSATASASRPDAVEVIDLDTEEFTRPAKRRTLPWLDSKSGAARPEFNDGSMRMKRPKQNLGDDVQTPARKLNGDQYLWNVTASAVKAEQKRHRLETNGPTNAKNKTNNVVDDEGATLRKAKTSKKLVSPVFLSEEQQNVLQLVVDSKKSVFFTGSAGTGKSVLMREIIAKLRNKHRNEADRVAVTASTGLAACNIGGNTLHSFSGIGLGKESVEQLCKKIRRNPKTVQRWQRTKVLIIDEISMIDGSLFDKLEGIARNIRRKAAPFGGIQLVITGDFFQLPPVGENGSAKFSFDAATWNTCIDHTIGLTHVFRQKDPVFAGMLNEMRVGKLSPESIRAFQKLSRPIDGQNEVVEATELFSTRNEVDQANFMRLRKLGGTSVDFVAQDEGTMSDKTQRDKLLANCMAPVTLTLKKGAQVMLIKNIDDSLVNGSIGKVVAFMDERTFDYYNENEEEFLSTGPSLDVDADGDGASARKNLKGYVNPAAANTSQKWPIVRFQISDGTSRDLMCIRETWKIEQPNGEVLASRAQIPLILAWALSIHKAQGQTLERVKVDLRRVFEKGQAYVALSRATTQAGLQVTGFNPAKVQAHDRVRKFYDSLYGVDTILGATAGPATGKTVTKQFKDEFLFDSDDEHMMAQIPM